MDHEIFVLRYSSPDPDPKLDLNLIKNHQKTLQFDNSDIKNTLI
jgi:hypothetical protein